MPAVDARIQLKHSIMRNEIIYCIRDACVWCGAHYLRSAVVSQRASIVWNARRFDPNDPHLRGTAMVARF